MIRESLLSTIWPLVKLGDVIEFLDHKRKPITAKDRVFGPYPYYGANGQQDSVNDYLFDEPLILLAEDGGNFGNPDRTIAYQVDGKTWVNNHAHVLRPTSKIDIRYLCRQLEKYDVSPYINGATRQKLNKSAAQEITISLPPLPEQKRIAAILDKADAICRKRQQAIDLADEFLRSVFLDMFGDPVTNPKGFQKRLLKEFYFDEKKGTKCGPFGSALKKDEYQPNGIPVWNMDNINLSGDFQDNPSLWISEEKFEELKPYSVEKGDVIISRAGTVGKMGVVDSEFSSSIISTNLIRLRFGNELLPEYFVSLMTYCKGRVGRLRTGPDGAFTHMNTKILDNLEFPYPSIELQNKFLRIKNKVVDRKGKKVDTSAIQLDKIFNSLSQQAFAGKL